MAGVEGIVRRVLLGRDRPPSRVPPLYAVGVAVLVGVGVCASLFARRCIASVSLLAAAVARTGAHRLDRNTA